jgi:hypothetical protein
MLCLVIADFFNVSPDYLLGRVKLRSVSGTRKEIAMDNGKFQELVLQQLQTLAEGQKLLQADVTSIKNELRYVWEDIKRIDKRLSTQEEEVVILKRLK